MQHDVKPAELTLFHTGVRHLMIRPQVATAFDPIVCREWDLGAPEVRTNYVPRPGRDGVDYGAGYLGARTVTFDLVIQGGRNYYDGQTYDAYWYVEQLTRMTHPQSSVQLLATRETPSILGQQFRMVLQGNPFSITYGRRAAALLELQLAFTAPTGLLEGPLRQAATVPLTTYPAIGWTFPQAFPVQFYGVTTNDPHMRLEIGGSTPVMPKFYIVGPAVNPHFYVERPPNSADPKLEFVLDGLTVDEGHILEVDMGAATVRLAGPTGVVDPFQALYNRVDFTRSTFWRLNPGRQYIIRYRSDAGGAMVVQWRENRFTI